MHVDRQTPLAGWRAVVLVAATYIYFLIFAQFGFLKRLAELGIADEHLKQVMGAMALGGVTSSLLAVRWAVLPHPSRLLRWALAGCALAALLSGLQLPVVGAGALALLIGISLGMLTVTLVANLRVWTGTGEPLLRVGLGTGLGYLVCNFPPLFTASPGRIGVMAALVCCAGIAAGGEASADAPAKDFLQPLRDQQSLEEQLPFALLLVWFTALVWFDSAAFFIIQNSPALKSGTWEGAAHLWRNGVLHLLAALGSVFLLRKRGLAPVLLLAFACLATACLLLDAGRFPLGSLFYPVGVSLYSAALVAYPSFLLQAVTPAERTRQAGLIYAIAGWLGSALGIGMAQNLHRVPSLFIAAAGVLLIFPLVWRFRRARWREASAVAGVLLASFLLWRVTDKPRSPASPIARGRQVYIAEGCIHCHSQYVRPHTGDVLLWGPASSLDAIRRQQPPLIGNRRQGPDLSEVGARRSPLWLRLHFLDPRIVSPGSIMPSYRALFVEGDTDRGEALLAYVESLQSPGSAEHLRATVAAWHPAQNREQSREQSRASDADGKVFFGQFCATCHALGGKARKAGAGNFRRMPPLLFTEPWLDMPAEADRLLWAERVIKFGLPGTDMPGHEYLPDDEVAAIARFVVENRQPER